MGDKTAARRAAIECNVPVVPGTNQALNNVQEAMDFAAEAGYPVILKASMGGGGRGMRVVRNGGRAALCCVALAAMRCPPIPCPPALPRALLCAHSPAPRAAAQSRR
jgi:biotin carboxylase